MESVDLEETNQSSGGGRRESSLVLPHLKINCGGISSTKLLCQGSSNIVFDTSSVIDGENRSLGV